MNAYAPFWQVTGEALDHCLVAHGIADKNVREKLMGAYLALDPFPEVPAMLDALARAGKRLAILSNGNPEMLEPMVAASGWPALRRGAERRYGEGLQGRSPSLSPGRNAPQCETGEGVLPLVQLLGCPRRAQFGFDGVVGQSDRRARRQSSGASSAS
jgi:hypothetical protein